MSKYLLPGTYIAQCSKCGKWVRWCTHDASRETQNKFFAKSRKRGDKVTNLKFGAEVKGERCACARGAQ